MARLRAQNTYAGKSRRRFEGLWVVCLAPRLSYGAMDSGDVSRFCWNGLSQSSRDLCCEQNGIVQVRKCPQETQHGMMFPDELCCLGDAFRLPVCGQPVLEALVAQLQEQDAGTSASMQSAQARLSLQPARIFNVVIEALARIYLGEEPVQSEMGAVKFSWQALERASQVVRQQCPVAFALSRLLRVEAMLASSLLQQGTITDDVSTPQLELAAALALEVKEVLPPCPTSQALLIIGSQRLQEWWTAISQSKGAPGRLMRTWTSLESIGFPETRKLYTIFDACLRDGQGTECMQLRDSSFLRTSLGHALQLESNGLERQLLRAQPNALCWAHDRRSRGLTPEACCKNMAGDDRSKTDCWDDIFSPEPCCTFSNHCGDLVFAAVEIGETHVATDDPIRDFHRLLQDLFVRSKVPIEDSPPFVPLWALVSGWPKDDLQRRCPEAWFLVGAMEAVASAGSPLSRSLGSLKQFYNEHSRSFTSLSKFVYDSLPHWQNLDTSVEGVVDVASGALHGGNASGLEFSGDASAWRERLQNCASSICNENSVDESNAIATTCSAILVRSDHGGAGRTTMFGRALWCAARFSTGPVLDLYAGKGDTVSLLADAVQKRTSGNRVLITFEISKSAAATTTARLRHYGFSVFEVSLLESSITEARVMEAMSWSPPLGRAGVIVFIASTATPVEPGNRRLLAVVSNILSSLALVYLDPDIEMDPHSFAADWRLLEKLDPRMVAVYNTNLPGGPGWVRERLLHIGTYSVIGDGHNDGGADEPDELLQLRAWSLLLYSASLPAHIGTRRPETKSAQYMIDSLVNQGAHWSNTTFRSSLQGKVKKIHEPLDGSLLAVELQRPTSDLLSPPLADTNLHSCFADPIAAQRLRVPCFLACDGPTFDSGWSEFRDRLIENVKLGYPPNQDLFMQANLLAAQIVQNDTALIIGRSRFMSRLRHEFTSDDHVSGFCLYGIANAMFIRARHFLEMQPREFFHRGKLVFAPTIARNDLEVAFSILADSNTKASIEFSFLENTAWPVRLEDIIVNFERQRAHLGAPFEIFSFETWKPMPTSLGLVGNDGDSQHPVAIQSLRSLPHHLRICGVGDHLTATFDTMLMVEQSLQSVGTSIQFERHMLGRFCPAHSGQQHQCRQRCQLLGVGCGDSSQESDPIEKWLDGVIHPETFEELAFDLMGMASDLVQQVETDSRLNTADVIVCSHPTILCIVLSTISATPVFTHASSTLLYGLFCDRCSTASLNVHSTLRLYKGDHVLRYLSGTRALYEEAANKHVLFAEGAFLAAQIAYQVQMTVPWVPPLALYVQHRWTGKEKRNAVVLRSRFFTTLMGELLRSLIREIHSINNMKITFLGADNQFDEQWLTLEEIAGFGAAVLYPNDIHQRTFHEVYGMGLPLFVPDALGLYRSQRAANWGYSSYGVSLFPENSQSSAAPWWNSFNATPNIVVPFQALADWEQFPHVQRFPNIASLIYMLSLVDLEEVSRKMLDVHKAVRDKSLQAVATKVVAMLR